MSARPKCPECGLVMVAGGVSAPPHSSMTRHIFEDRLIASTHVGS